MTRTLLRNVGGVAAGLVAACGPAAAAQPADVLPQVVARTEGRLSLEGYVSQYRLRLDQAGRVRPSGYGARVLWSLAPRTDPSRLTLAARTAVGPFAVHAPQRPGEPAAWHAGAHADFRLAPSLLAARLDPVFSLALGGFRIADRENALRPLGPRRGAAHRTTHLSITPGLGARIFIAPGFAIRADVRDVVVTGDRTRHFVEVAGGMSLVM